MTDKMKAVSELKNAGLEAAEADSAVMVYLSQEASKKEIDELRSRAGSILERIGYHASWGISTRIPKDMKPESTQTEDMLTEDTPADDTPAEDTPAEDTPAEDTPAEDTPAEDTPAEDTPAEDMQIEATQLSLFEILESDIHG